MYSWLNKCEAHKIQCNLNKLKTSNWKSQSYWPSHHLWPQVCHMTLLGTNIFQWKWPPKTLHHQIMTLNVRQSNLKTLLISIWFWRVLGNILPKRYLGHHYWTDLFNSHVQTFTITFFLLPCSNTNNNTHHYPYSCCYTNYSSCRESILFLI